MRKCSASTLLRHQCGIPGSPPVSDSRLNIRILKPLTGSCNTARILICQMLLGQSTINDSSGSSNQKFLFRRVLNWVGWFQKGLCTFDTVGFVFFRPHRMSVLVVGWLWVHNINLYCFRFCVVLLVWLVSFRSLGCGRDSINSSVFRFRK